MNIFTSTLDAELYGKEAATINVKSLYAQKIIKHKIKQNKTA